MLVKLETRKSILSNWLIITFFLLLVFSAFISEIFQAPKNLDNEISRYQRLFEPQQLSALNGLTLKNNLGTFKFEKDLDLKTPDWKMIVPRNLPANMDKINSIIKALEKLKIRKIFQKDKINIQNFSLDDPLLELTLHSANGLKSSLTFGLINPIDNSTYAILSTHEAIYHVDAIGTNLSSWDLSHFVDSKVFTLNYKKINRIKIYRGLKKSNKIALHYKFKKGNWTGKNSHLLNPEKVLLFLKRITTLKSNFIIDKNDEKTDEKLRKSFSKPLYIIEIQDKQKNTYHYEVSNLLSGLPGLRLEKWQNFAIKASNRQHPYIFKKEILKVLVRPESKVRSLPIKKLFY